MPFAPFHSKTIALAAIASVAIIAAPLTADMAAGYPAPLPAQNADSDQATLTVRLVQVHAERLQEIELAEDSTLSFSESWGFSIGGTIGSGGVRIKPLVFFLGDDGEVRIGQQVWQLGAALDDAKRGIVRPGSPFTVLSAPKISCRIGETAVLTMGAPIEYMVKEANGCLRLADERDEAIEEEGVSIRLQLGGIQNDIIELDSIDVSLRRVKSREPIDGVPLDIGRPEMREDRVERDLRLSRSQVAVMPLASENDSSTELILVVISWAE